MTPETERVLGTSSSRRDIRCGGRVDDVGGDGEAGGAATSNARPHDVDLPIGGEVGLGDTGEKGGEAGGRVAKIKALNTSAESVSGGEGQVEVGGRASASVTEMNQWIGEVKLDGVRFVRTDWTPTSDDKPRSSINGHRGDSLHEVHKLEHGRGSQEGHVSGEVRNLIIIRTKRKSGGDGKSKRHFKRMEKVGRMNIKRGEEKQHLGGRKRMHPGSDCIFQTNMAIGPAGVQSVHCPLT